MNISEKSIAYAFIANGIHLYFSEEDFFLVSRLVCKDCGDYWYMNLTECFICGALNPFLYKCNSCGSFQSITKSSHKCSNCDSEELFMTCPNPDCLSNTDTDILSEANKFGGVFNKNSGLLISQQYCLNCGSKSHVYKTFRIFVRAVKSKTVKFDTLEINREIITDNDYLIIKYLANKDSIKYRLYKIQEIIGKVLELDNLHDNFNGIVSELYPMKKEKVK